MTYREAGEARTAIGSGLVHLGVTPGSTIGIYSINSVGKFIELDFKYFSCLNTLSNPSILDVPVVY
jgi:long-subunit acyl-CoA synthetase (AMP-forming)